MIFAASAASYVATWSRNVSQTRNH